MNMWMIILTYFICFFSVIASFLIIPFVSRKNVNFGISIPKELFDSKEIKKIRTNYLRRGILFSLSLISFVIIWDLLISNQGITILIIIPAVFLLIIGFIFLYLISYKEMKKLKVSSDWKFQTRQVVSPLWFGLYFIVIISTILFDILLYHDIPNQVPVHFGFNGYVDRFAQKSYKTLLAMPLTQLLMTIVFIFSYWIIGKAKQQIDANNPEASKEQSRKFRYRWSAFLIFSGLGLIIMFSLIQASIIGLLSLALSAVLPLIFSALMILGIIILILTTGQSGNKIHVNFVRTKSGIQIIRDDDRLWKFGALYYNPKDPALFVEKRFGIGWTINMGRPLAWVFLIGIILLTIGFSVLITNISK